MKHLIVGTAGHIDHGKTALVKALTGIDCDTHQEEKRRGITINLGFAHLALGNGMTVGVVDVPGHRDFVHTMVSGSSGIDIALLVIAADEGIMPQTREHLQIMEILGIKSGIIALNKCDKVDATALKAQRGSIAEFVHNTFLENAPVCDVSSTMGTGITELRATIASVAANVQERSLGQVFRMYIDRIFSVSGFGTVVTGSVKGGSLKVNQTAFLLPANKEVRVRRLERFGEEIAEILAGDRASCNLVGLSKDDFKRGMLIADRPLNHTKMFDARVTLFTNSRPLSIWTHVILLKDTYETQARIHLLDADTLAGGAAALVQAHVDDPCVARSGDRFVIRSSSGDATLGGGEIIDASPLHHRRRPPSLINGLITIASGELHKRIAAQVQKHLFGIRVTGLAETLNCATGEIEQALSDDINNGIVTYGPPDGRFLISASNNDLLVGDIKKTIQSYHASHPLEKKGRTHEELLGALGITDSPGRETFLALILQDLVKSGALCKAGHTYILPDHTVVLSPDQSALAAKVEAFVAAYGMQAPLPAELLKKADTLLINAPQLHSVLKYLTDSGVLYAIEGTYVHSRIVDECRKKLVLALRDKKEGITIAGFRDLVSGNRKICLLLMAIYDREGTTERRGDVRVITEKGMDRAHHY
jgi:selenocysteine-specific elongation factor